MLFVNVLGKLKNYEEHIWPNVGHGVMLYFHTDEYVDAVRETLKE